ncbi:MAG: type II toxin-antitoxin system VapC family toxin [Wenzhouxiangellaceae bacterium]|nr:type II toxin-antitoxin system VapC family toxin [Wenzhouxiangellaceae bacterium]
MTYWDASALVSLLVREPETSRVQTWLNDDPMVVTWVWTRVEITSAIERRHREGLLTRRQRRDLLTRLDALARQWDEIIDSVAVRRQAIRALARHPLRAADAAQLGAAIIYYGGDPAGGRFACLDRRLTEAAELEGFSVLGATD